MKNSGMIILCGKSFPAVLVTLEFLLNEQKKREEENSHTKYRKKKKITNTIISQILSESFGSTPRYFSKVRQYYSNAISIENITPLKNPCFNFAPDTMKRSCSKVEITVPKSLIDFIQIVSNQTYTVSDILSGKLSPPPHKETITNVKKYIQEFTSILERFPNTKYWKSLFNFFPDISTSVELLTSLAFFPQCELNIIQSEIVQIERYQASKKIGEILSAEKTLSFLLTYRHEIQSFNESLEKETSLDKIFDSIMVNNFFIAHTFKPFFEIVSQNHIRPDDLYLVYLIETYLNPGEKEVILDEIGFKISSRD